MAQNLSAFRDAAIEDYVEAVETFHKNTTSTYADALAAGYQILETHACLVEIQKKGFDYDVKKHVDAVRDFSASGASLGREGEFILNEELTADAHELEDTLNAFARRWTPRSYHPQFEVPPALPTNLVFDLT